MELPDTPPGTGPTDGLPLLLLLPLVLFLGVVSPAAAAAVFCFGEAGFLLPGLLRFPARPVFPLAAAGFKSRRRGGGERERKVLGAACAERFLVELRRVSRIYSRLLSPTCGVSHDGVRVPHAIKYSPPVTPRVKIRIRVLAAATPPAKPSLQPPPPPTPPRQTLAKKRM